MRLKASCRWKEFIPAGTLSMAIMIIWNTTEIIKAAKSHNILLYIKYFNNIEIIKYNMQMYYI